MLPIHAPALFKRSLDDTSWLRPTIEISAVTPARAVPIELHPLQQPYPPLWYPTHTPTSIEYAGRHGFNFVGLGPAAAVREHTDAYKRAWGAHRHDPID